MASIQFGGGITNAVGSHAGTTFARNKGGPYIKAKPHGTKPQTESQRFTQAYATQASKYWTYTLTDSQRMAWNVFASITPVINRLGQQNYISGQQMFMKLTAKLIGTGGTIVATPPATTAVGTPLALTVAAVHGGGGSLTLTLTATGAGGSDMAGFWVSPPMPPGRSNISSQLRNIFGLFTIGAASNVTTPYKLIFGALPSAAGQAVFVRGFICNSVTGIVSASLQLKSYWT